ncbi:MAG: hypothetical protein PHE27_05760 [Alphaproteobacteria bacterium]|nr:hypothetical protein [Alphaproteobacteria bacterium]
MNNDTNKTVGRIALAAEMFGALAAQKICERSGIGAIFADAAGAVTGWAIGKAVRAVPNALNKIKTHAEAFPAIARPVLAPC